MNFFKFHDNSVQCLCLIRGIPMSIADIEFMKMCRDILDNGTSTEGQKVRPHWPDGTPAYTIMKFCEINRFDLRKEFPMLTLRRTGI